MRRFYPFLCIPLLLATLMLIGAGELQSAYAQTGATPTPTYDPLAEPVIPENPSELDLGRNWYWHNCMTCHGDVGQGLTDEFRAIWPEDHQNCWEHGCHGGRMDDEGFPIPTSVPALVGEEKLDRFSSQQGFYEFLKSTHPPQDPGGLEDKQYQAIVNFVFSMNNRPLENPPPTVTITTLPNPVSTQVADSPLQEVTPERSNTVFYIGLGIVLIVVFLWGIKNRFPRP